VAVTAIVLYGGRKIRPSSDATTAGLVSAPSEFPAQKTPDTPPAVVAPVVVAPASDKIGSTTDARADSSTPTPATEGAARQAGSANETDSLASVNRPAEKQRIPQNSESLKDNKRGEAPGAGLTTSNVVQLDNELEPLKKPDLQTARLVVANLSKLASNQSGQEKVRTQRVAALVKNLFTAEFQVAEAFRSIEKNEVEVTRLQQTSRDWMIPNVWGKVNETAARDALVRAKEIKDKAAQRLENAQKELLDQLREADSLTHDFYDFQDFGVVFVLSGAVNAITERSLPKGMFKPSLPQAAIANLREFVQSRDEWLLTAKTAEEAENFEEAIRYYSKAKDHAGRKRCALRIAKELESGGLFGSAIDYYEIAGDLRKAGSVRQAHPDLRLDAFRKLNSEDLYAKVAPCCVRISSRRTLGSGFFFKRGGYILTNRHVIDQLGAITVKLDDGRSFEAQTVTKSANLDLAIIRIPLEDHDSVGFRNAEGINIGMQVCLIGYPELDLPTATMNSGRISNNDRIFQGNPVYQLDVSANHGNSGGPVVDDSGRLVGILTFGLKDLDIDRFNFAIKGEAVRDFVKKEMSE